ncbi:MAG: extracellular solute-binding protein [Erysipelotrichaceae bacterium]|nr:extracellular solute-binding protein [Erysipelotrichaceae bacterium]
MKKLIPVLVSGLIMTGCIGVRIVPETETAAASLTKNIIVTDPSEKVVLNIADWSDSTKASRQALNEAFEKDHPNVTINYTCLSQDQFNETVVAGIRSGTAPDLFPLPSTLSLSQAVSENWFLPLDWYLDQEFLNEIKPECWSENVTLKDQVPYLLPEAEEISSTLMYCNEDLLEQAGIELPDRPLSWTEFKDICRRITEAGDGEYYPLAASGKQKNRVDLELRALAQLNHATVGPADQLFLSGGKTTFDTTPVLEAFDFYRDLYDQKAFHPDSASLSAPEARKLFAQGKLAFLVQGAWCIPVWEAENPELNFSVTWLPSPGGSLEDQTCAPFTKGWMGISAQSQHPDVAAEYLKYLYSFDYQKSLVDQGGFVSVRSDLGQDSISDPVMKSYYSKALEQSSRIENPLSKYPENQQVYDQLESVSFDFGDIAASLLSGSKNYQKELSAYGSCMQENLEAALNSPAVDESVQLDNFNVKERK